MFTLFIDTHYKDIKIYLFKNNEVISKEELSEFKSTSTDTMPTITKVLEQANIDVHKLNKIAVCIGPGSFTGTRIGVTIAKTLAYSLNIPIVSLNSLEIVSLNANKETYLSSFENNGVFIAYFDTNKIDTIKYLKESEYSEFKAKNSVLEDDTINPTKLINYINKLKEENPHNVNPLYVKQIEALK